MIADASIMPLVIEAADLLREKHHTLATVESCTGGMVGAALTTLPGISDVYLGGYITYSNEMKTEMVGVDPSLIEQHGAVSAQIAIEMCIGAWYLTRSTYAISITGIAGPDGGTDDKPVGTVWICVLCDFEEVDCRRFIFPNDRASVRTSAGVAALSMLIQNIRGIKPQPLDHQHEQILERTQA